MLVIFSSKDQINVIRKPSYQITISNQMIVLDECISKILTQDEIPVCLTSFAVVLFTDLSPTFGIVDHLGWGISRICTANYFMMRGSS